MRIIVLLGAPGAGKGTQAAVLAGRLGLPHVATGDLFRAAVREGTPLGVEAQRYMARGELVPDRLAARLLMERLDQPDATGGVILDGFPRTRAQAEVLDGELGSRGGAIDLVLLIEVPVEELVERMSGRWICRLEGHVFNVTTNAPSRPGICDVDGSELIQRDDDRPAVVRARLDQQLGALGEVIDHYTTRGVLRTVDGRGDIAAVTERLLDAVGTVAGRGV